MPQPAKNPNIPPNLLAGLKKMEESGDVPFFIPKTLELFLSEAGIYETSMTPQEAWEALARLYAEDTAAAPNDDKDEDKPDAV